MARGSLTGAEALVAQLEALGVDVVFGMPGVHNLAIFDALADSAIRTVTVRHEQTAGFAADGYARSTGRLGVCITTTGPGAANAMAAMGEARMARSPVLHLSTQVDLRSLEGRSGRFVLHESPDQLEVLRGVCRWAGRVQREDAVAQMTRRAAREAFGGRRGPAFLEIPFDILSAKVTRAVERVPALYKALPPGPAELDRALSAIGRLERPAIWAGGGVVSADAATELVVLAEALDAPVFTTFAGKGTVPGSHPLAVSLPPHEPDVAELLASCDGVVVVGSDLDGMNTQNWRLPLPRPRVCINVVAADARRNYPCDVVIEGDAKLALAALVVGVEPRRGNGAKRVASARRTAIGKLKRNKASREPMLFVERLRSAVPADAVIVTDMAVAGYWVNGYLATDAPRTSAYPAWGTLGFAFPAAIGVATSGRRAVVVCGDGGLAYAVGDLATAAQENLPVTILVVNDRGYGMLRFDQRERFKRVTSVDLLTPDIVKLAASFGVKARRTDLEGLEASLAWSLRRQGPSVVEMEAAFAPPATTSPRWPLRDRPEARL